MKKKQFRSLLVVLILLISQINIFASHLIGGNLGYEYVGQFGSLYRYKLILTTYTDCTPASQIPNPENPIQPVGVYLHNVQNNPMGGGAKAFLTSVNLNLINPGGTLITPNLPGGCSVGGNTCIRKGIYEGFVDVPLSFEGYHIFYERCCRNQSITNLIQNESMSFHAYIPPQLIPNNSPKFTDDPIPFLCLGETTTILNSAYDEDGDLLTFSFVTPYDGFSNATNPAPGPPSPQLPWTLPTVTYAGGFSTPLPFGAAGMSSINASTGLTTYTPSATGNYVVAVEIREFRNGNLIGVTRRDLQLLVINCPPNPTPVLSAALGTTNTQHSVEEGATLCFDFGYSDPNNNNVTLTSSGVLFNALFINPAATINSPITANTNVATQFCWTTACGQARPQPYQFQTNATDNGCPPKTANDVFQITVTPVAPPSIINGNQVGCLNAPQTYSTNLIAGATYNWTAIGGTILSQNANTVTVQWNNLGSNIISVNAVNQFGCSSQPIEMEVITTPPPSAVAGNDVTICRGSSVGLVGSTNANPGFTVNWTPIGIVSGGNTLTPIVAPTATQEYIFTVNIGNGCFGRDTVLVTVMDPQVDAGNDINICSGESAQLNATASAGTILWSPASTLNNATISNPIAAPNITTTYTIQLEDSFGCIATDEVTVNVAPVVVLTTSNDTTICFEDCINLFVSGAANYLWSPASGLNNITSASPIACPMVTTTYQVIGFNNFCTDTAYVTITVAPQLVANAGNDIAICLGQSTVLNGSGGVFYSWSPANSLNDASIASPIATPTITTNYTLMLTDALGCTSSDEVLITVNELPNVNAGEDKGICVSTSNGASVATEMLNGSGNGTPQWSPASGLSATNIFNPVINPTINTEYILTVTDINGCVNTDTVLVIVFDAVPTFAGNDTTICPGTSVILGGNPSALGSNTTFLWSPSQFLDNATLANPIATPTTTTMFYLVTNNDTCNGIDSVLITVNPLPNINAGNDAQICVGDSTTLNATGGVSYLWNNSASLSNINSNNPIAFPTITTTYIVVGTDILGCENSDTITVSVNELPLINAGNDVAICQNNTIQLQASGGTSYNWSPVASLNNAAISNPIANPISTTTYLLVGTDANSCTNTDSVTVTVNTLPAINISGDSAICIGIATLLTASGGINYTWTNTPTLSSLTTATTTATPIVNTTYEVLGTDQNGCQNTANFEVIVNNLPTISAGTNTTICFGQSSQLNATGGISYIWNTNTTLSATNIANPTASPTTTTTYTVTGEDINGCLNTATVTVAVNELPNISAGTAQSICVGSSTQLLATGGISYSWAPSSTLDNANINAPIASPSTTTTYTVTGTDINNCSNTSNITITVNNLPNISAGNDVAICIGNTTTLQASGGVSYTWSPATDLNNTTLPNPISSTINTITYTVTGVDINSCSNTSDVTVTVNPLPTINAGTNTSICNGLSTNLNATGGLSYIWSPAIGLSATTIPNPIANPTSAQTYTVIGTDANGCENNNTVTVLVNELPTINAGNDVNICLGDTHNLLAIGGASYIWSPTLFLNNNTSSNPVSTPDTTITYVVVGTDANGCINSDSVTINVFRIATIPDTSICIEGTVQLNVFGSPGNNYLWTPSTGLSNATIINPIASPISTTTYTVSVTDIAGCNDQDEVTITVNPKPNALLNYDIEIACEGGLVQFENQTSDGVSFLWDFGNGTTSSLENPSYLYNFSGNFNGNLTVTNSFGCSDITPFNLSTLGFDDYFDIIIPNVFTPNGDGENDLYKITVPGKIAECVTLSIFNRWGQLLFVTTGNNLTWDGYSSIGQPAPNGTYMYIIEVNDKKFNGTISLFR